MDEETSKKIQDLQILEQNLQNLLMQKQAFQVELNESSNALEEVGDTKDEIYKVLGSIMIKTDKEKVSKDLKDKRKLLELRMTSIEKQEKLFQGKADELRREINESVSEEKIKK
jgi:prefoldin beta subunit